MAVEPEVLYERIRAASDDDGRLGLSRMTGWEIFPYEPDGLRVVPVEPPSLPEEPRSGEGGRSCWACDDPSPAVWEDERWRLVRLPEESGVLTLMLQPKAHHDLSDLPDDLAGELGLLLVRTSRAVEALPNIARAHISKWGDGGAHLHVFVFARPEGFPQLRGTCLALWADALPALPDDEADADARAVGDALRATPLR